MKITYYFSKPDKKKRKETYEITCSGWSKIIPNGYEMSGSEDNIPFIFNEFIIRTKTIYQNHIDNMYNQYNIYKIVLSTMF